MSGAVEFQYEKRTTAVVVAIMMILFGLPLMIIIFVQTEKGEKMKGSYKVNASAPIINPIASLKTMKVVRNDKVIIVPQKNIYTTEKELAEVRRRTKEQLDENGIAILPCGYTAKVIGNDYVMDVYE